jgi:hypothetical protein
MAIRKKPNRRNPAAEPIRKKPNPLTARGLTRVDYKDVTLLRMFLSERGKIRVPPGHRVDRPAATPGRHGHQECQGHGPAALLGYLTAGTRRHADFRSSSVTSPAQPQLMVMPEPPWP